MPFVLEKNHLGRASIGFPTDDFERFKGVARSVFAPLGIRELKRISVDIEYVLYQIGDCKFALIFDDLDLTAFSAETEDGDALVNELFAALQQSQAD